MITINYQRLLTLGFLAVVLSGTTLSTHAAQYSLPSNGNDVIGGIEYVSGAGDTVINLAQRYDVGVNAVLNANPGLPDKTPLSSGTVRIPSAYILPQLPRQGIVINLAEMRMYYYPADGGKVMTFPVGIGKANKTVPLGHTAIARKVVNPTWTPTENIRQFNREQGIELPKSMGPGPDNPLGPYAIYLRVPTYLIHSTIFPESIGRRASFGCIRMHETDIQQLFPSVTPNTPVSIVDITAKAGWNGKQLYLETHPPLEERGDGGINSVVNSIEQATPAGETTLINWQLVSYLNEQRDGVPHEIGFRAE